MILRSASDHPSSLTISYRFYYADERTSSGAAVGKSVDGQAAAEDYWNLAQRKDQGPWLYTFVKGEGYKDFSAGQ